MESLLKFFQFNALNSTFGKAAAAAFESQIIQLQREFYPRS